MNPRHKQKQPKTCWSVLVKFFSGLKPSQLLLGYLAISGTVLNNFANAQDTVTETYYLGGNRQNTEPSAVCINAAPRCILSVKSMFSDRKLDGFNVQQECDESDKVIYVGRASLATQVKVGLFHGNRLCNGTLTNHPLENPLISRFRHNTNYAIKLGEEDRVEITYTPLFAPNLR